MNVDRDFSGGPVKADGLGMVFEQIAAHPLPLVIRRLPGGLGRRPFSCAPARRQAERRVFSVTSI